MPVTVTNMTGDGLTSTMVETQIQLPDSGASVLVGGRVQAVGRTAQNVTGSPLTAPAPPGSGSIYWNVQVDTTSGAASVQQSTVSDPAPIANNVVVFRQTLVPTSTDMALVQGSTPDTY